MPGDFLGVLWGASLYMSKKCIKAIFLFNVGWKKICQKDVHALKLDTTILQFTSFFEVRHNISYLLLRALN